MYSHPTIDGTTMDPQPEPDWQPLLNLASRDVDAFMWMFAVEGKDGRRIHAYKHYWTRGYLHLDGAGRAYVYTDDDRYRQVDASWLLERVLADNPCY